MTTIEVPFTNPLVRIQTRDRINIKLTNEETRDRAMLLPKLLADLDAVEEEAKAVAKEYKKKIERCDSELREMRRIVDSGEEFREVDCVRVFDVAKGITWLEFAEKNYLQRSATQKELELLRQGDMFENVEEEASEEETTDEEAAF